VTVPDSEPVTVTVVATDGRPGDDPAGDAGAVETRLTVPRGTVLRDALLDAGISPYTRYTERLNCGGRGLCATCGVRVLDGDHDPDHWHDRLAARFGYPRLSCQMRVTEDLTVAIPDKRVWGERRPED
jgi:ferredoxin